ncbi:hypothetical protein CYMTET_16890 [Cymbomonas tetramitiformis]|uniref:UBX domain-containing protein n=1 Tax=Cymbomonas tetramitiformis TaxID=36881 RepID=A0AAE0GCI1_9CHLO|nr:hypothetical protein CYMTET_16890 [Cymbomonas tetramitiformis]
MEDITRFFAVFSLLVVVVAILLRRKVQPQLHETPERDIRKGEASLEAYRKVQKYSAHRNYSRVEGWLHAHSFYLKALSDMQIQARGILNRTSPYAVADQGSTSHRLQLSGEIDRIRREYDDFEAFLQDHSEREERHLFPFLLQTCPGPFKEAYAELSHDHKGYGRVIAGIRSTFDHLQEDWSMERHQRFLQELQSRSEHLARHFQVEEAACIRPLLELTDAQYDEYLRSMVEGTGPGRGEVWQPFIGKGRRCDARVSEDVGVQNECSQASTTSLRNVPVVNAINVDESKPVVLVRVRLFDGSNNVVRLNDSHTLAMLHSHVAHLTPSVQSFSLTTVYPKRSIDCTAQTMSEAGLHNETIMQITDAP